MEYTPRPQFLAFHNRQQRWAELLTHRRAGKTVSLVNDLIIGALECQKYRPQLVYLGPTYTQAKRIAWQYLVDYAEKYSTKVHQADLKVTLINDATITVLGADNADSLRGIYLDGAVMDEYALFKPSVFSQIIRPALSDRLGWGVFASTPRGKNVFHKVDQQARNNPDTWHRTRLSADTSGIIPAAELEELRQDMDPEEFAQEYLCSFDSALKGAIYADEINLLFMEKRTTATYEPSLPVHVVFDLGFTDATVAIWFQVHKDGTVCVVSVEATTGKDIFHHIGMINQFEGELGDVWLPHDARAKNLQTGKSLIEQFLKQGITPRIVPNHKVRDRIAATRREFPRIRINESSTGDLIEALKAYQRSWNDTTLMFSDIPLHDWASDFADSFGYMCVVLTPRQSLTRAEQLETEASEFNLNNLFTDNEQRMLGMSRRIQ